MQVKYIKCIYKQKKLWYIDREIRIVIVLGMINMQVKRNFSAKREAIYKAISDTSIHPSAEWLYEQLKPNFPDLSLGTVYRNLAVFKQNGVVKSLGVFNGQERFDHDLSQHSHFVCERCFSIQDVLEGVSEQDMAAYGLIEREYGAKVRGHSVIFYGLCENCRAREKECQYPGNTGDK